MECVGGPSHRMCVKLVIYCYLDVEKHASEAPLLQYLSL